MTQKLSVLPRPQRIVPKESKEVATVSAAERALAEAKTPQESKMVEAMAVAVKAWAKEAGDFETLIGATRILFLARRKTTELSKYLHPWGTNGGDRRSEEFSSISAEIRKDPGFGSFTAVQWTRRLHELEEVNEDDIDEYLAECTDKYLSNEDSWAPSVSGLMRFVSEPKPKQAEREDRWKDVQAWTAGIRAWLNLVDLLPESRKKHYSEVVTEQRELAELAKKANAIIGKADKEEK